MRARSRVGFIAFAISAVVLVPATRASATAITSPSPALVVSSNAAAVTIVARGFAPRSNVFVEQCDGVPTSDPRWSPTLNCDLGTSPAPVTADAQGTATFDGQRSFRAFKGESPQSLFNCLAPGQPAPRNALPSFSDCRVRVSTNNSAATPDQAFLPIRLSVATSASGAPAPPAAATATTKPVRRAATPVAPRRSRKTTTTTADVRVSSNARAAGTERSRATSSSGSRPASGGALTGYALVAIGLAVALAMRRWLPAQAHRT